MRYLIYLLLLISSSLYAQDSLKLYSVPKYKLDRLLNTYFYIQPLCDSTVQKQQKAIEAISLTLQASIKIDSIHTLQRDNKLKEAETLRKQADNDKTLHKGELKAEKKKRFKVTLVAIGEALVVIFLIL